MKSYSLSIVIPCLNEEETIGIVVNKSIKIIDALGIDGEVLVSDNGSTDKSVEISEGLGARVVKCPNRGYGNALKFGFSQAKGDVMIMGDADDSYNFEEIEPFITTYENNPGVDIVIGNRLKGKIEKGAMPRLHRYLGTPVLTKVLNLFFGTKIGDCNCGMRLITKKSFEKLNLKSDGMEFASEMIIKAGLHKFNIIEIITNLYKDKRTKPPHLHTRTDGRRHLRYMLLLAPHYLFFGPGVVLSVVGILLLGVQILGPVDLFGVHMDIHYMILGLTLSILGNIILVLGSLIQSFSDNEGIPQRKTVFTRFIERITLEKGIIIGLLIFFLGLGLDISTLHNWLSDFAHWNPIMETRKSIVGGYLMVLGLMTFFFSFAQAMIKNKK